MLPAHIPQDLMQNIYFRWVNVLRGLIILFVLAAGGSCDAQPDSLRIFETHYQQALEHDRLNLPGPCIEEINRAIEYATAHHMEEQRIRATITLAEVLRKTNDYDKGLALLKNLTQSTTYPALHVRKLGRMAAIYSEWTHNRDSILHYLDSALSLARSLGLKAEMAPLYNEYGYTILATSRQQGIAHLHTSARLFREMHDTLGYVSPLINLLRNYIFLKDRVRADSLLRELIPLMQNRKWYTAQTQCYKLAANYHKLLLHDSSAAAYWNALADKSTIVYLESINTAQVNAFRTMYATRQLQNQVDAIAREARQKQEELEQQAKRTRELVVYLSVTLLLVLLVIALLLRENKLKQRLKNINEALLLGNQKYQLLMQESNHRIKNNLQMITSMLQYEQNHYGEEVAEAFTRLLGKIRTVGALHKHLSVEIHNELVPMDAYFREIISLYQDMAGHQHNIAKQVAPIKIKSERMVYFGLILNEMIVNTLTHGKKNNMQFSVTPLLHGYRFSYSDDSAHPASATAGTGTMLIRQLIERVGGRNFIFEELRGYYQFDFDE